MSTCTIQDCENPVVGRGWCRMHYMRWKRWGNPLEPDHRSTRPRSVCTVDGCGKFVASNGLCSTHRAQAARAANPMVGPFERTCSFCGDQFLSRYRERATFCSVECKRRERIASGRAYEASRKVFLRNKYGISVERYEELRDAQNSACAICGRTDPVGRVSRHSEDYWLHVDHDHETGRIRGLLCGECNTGLGKFADSAALLRKAADYLA